MISRLITRSSSKATSAISSNFKPYQISSKLDFSTTLIIKNNLSNGEYVSTNISKLPDPLVKITDSKASNDDITIIQQDFGENSEVIDDETFENKHHYLDTMEIYNDLIRLDFTPQQSDLILSLLQQNLTKSLNKLEANILTTNELENDSYLFEAARSELTVEVKTSRELSIRQLENEKFLTEILLNEEQDSLNNQLIMSKNDSEVVISDQISENTLLQKKIKKKIQDLNSRISTEINGDIKSEIESLRWHTTRSGLMAVLVLVFSVMGGVSISKKMNKDSNLQQVILTTIERELDDGYEDDEKLKDENINLYDDSLKEKKDLLKGALQRKE